MKVSSFIGSRFPTREGGQTRIVKPRGSAQGSHLETLLQLCSSSGTLAKILPQIFPKFIQKLAKIPPRPSQILPDPSPNPSKINSKIFLETILDQCFTKARSWRPKKPPRSAQKRPREAPDSPNPSQMEPKTLPKPIFRLFLTIYFPTINLHLCFDDGLTNVYDFSKTPNPKHINFP